MSAASNSPDESLSLEAQERIAEKYLAFSQAWLQGEQPSIEQFLEGSEGQERAELLRLLLLEEFLLKSQMGEKLSFADYYQRFPNDPTVVSEAQRQFQNDETCVPRESEPPTPGERLQYVGNYEILKEIGRGGMGIVYQARQMGLGRIVAVKILLNSQFATSEDILRFEREAQLTAKFHHPNIVAVHEVGRHQGCPYFSMDYVEGQSLAAMVREHPLPPQAATRYVQVAATAVDRAHEAGILHRDLKPSNILIDAEDQIRITDFGLAKQLGSDETLTETGAILGTASYMPPEQAVGNQAKIGVRSDVYSLGAVLYELLTGRPPFAAATVLETLHQVKTQDPVSPRVLNPNVPKDLETICLKCLEKEPEQRFYGGAAALARDLGNFLEGRPIGPRPSGQLDKVWRWCQRNPQTAGLISALILVLLVGIVASATFAFIAEQRAQSFSRLAEKYQSLGDDEQNARRKAEFNANEAAQQRMLAVESQHRVEQMLYVSLINLAFAEWERGNIVEAFQHLSACPLEYRDWEYDYLLSLFTSNHVTLKNREGRIHALAYSPDGSLIAGAGQKSVKVWRTRTGQMQLTLAADDAFITSIAFSADGKYLASGNDHKTVKVWDAHTGQPTLTLLAIARVECIAFSSDSKYLVSGSGNTLEIWEVASGRRAGTLPGHSVNAVAFSPDGTWIASGSRDKTVKLWSVTTGELIDTLQGHDGIITTIAFSPDGSRIAAGGFGKAVNLWDTHTRKIVSSLSCSNWQANSLAFSPDGKQIVCGGMVKGTVPKAKLLVWDCETSNELFDLRGHVAPVECVAFSPDGKKVASGGQASSITTGEIKIWDLERSHTPQLLHIGPPNSLVSDPNAKCAVSLGSDQIMKLWDLEAAKEIQSFRGKAPGINLVKLSPNKTWLVTGSTVREASGYKTHIQVWKVANGREGFGLAFDGFFPPEQVSFTPDEESILFKSSPTTIDVRQVSNGQLRYTLMVEERVVPVQLPLSPDGKCIVTEIGNTTPQVRFVATGQLRFALKGHTAPVNAIKFSPDGRWIVTASDDKTVRVWHADSGEVKHLLKAHISEVVSVVFSPDGNQFITGSRDKSLVIWDIAAGRKTNELLGDFTNIGSMPIYWPLNSPFYSRDGKWILARCGLLSNEIKIWEAKTGLEKHILQGHSHEIRDFVFSPENTRIISCSLDGAIKLWDLGSGLETLTLRGHARGVSSVTFSTDEHKIISCGYDGHLLVWDSAGGQWPETLPAYSGGGFF